MLNKKQIFLTQFNHTMTSVIHKPSVYTDPVFKQLQECCEYRDWNRDLFPPFMGNVVFERPNNDGFPTTDLIKGYTSAIVSCGDLSIVTYPFLQVVSNTILLHSPAFGKALFRKPQQKVKITHICLLDGGNNTIIGRLVINVMSEGKKLRTGDIFRC